MVWNKMGKQGKKTVCGWLVKKVTWSCFLSSYLAWCAYLPGTYLVLMVALQVVSMLHGVKVSVEIWGVFFFFFFFLLMFFFYVVVFLFLFLFFFFHLLFLLTVFFFFLLTIFLLFFLLPKFIIPFITSVRLFLLLLLLLVAEWAYTAGEAS